MTSSVGFQQGAQPAAGAADTCTETATPAMIKETVQETFNHYQVDSVDFTALSADEIARYSEVEVLNCAQYDLANEKPLVFGPLDGRMGTCSKTDICTTCGKRFEDCVGHFGHINLVMPVYHVGYLKQVYQVMQCICKACSRVLLQPELRERYLKRLRRSETDDFQRSSLHKRLIESCKKVRQCPYCGASNVGMKKGGGGVPLMLRHLIGPAQRRAPEDVSAQFAESFHDAKAFNKDLDGHVDKASQDFNPLACYHTLQKVTPQDRELLGLVPPERLMMTFVPVPPVCIRPTVSMGDKGTREDDLTMAIGEIVKANQSLQNHLARNCLPKQVMEAWEFLQEACARYVNSEVSGLSQMRGTPMQSICSRLKGKEGRFRGNLSGKRVNFSGRTVISPDPNVSVEQVVVPDWVAKRMTYPEKVCDANIDRLREAIRRGPEEHPGACFVHTGDGRKKFLGPLKKNFRKLIADSLHCGDLVERHMHDGDIVLFNRQPSLHRLSIMAHKAKVMPGRTFRFNECVCAPYNADFDGDEMNLHLPQTEEARAEALQLMGVRDGLVTPKSGEVAVCATQDFLTGAFLMTQKDVYLSRDKFCQLCCFLSDGLEPIDLPPPAILKPCELWTGKQAFSVMVRPNRKSKVLVNLEIPEKNYSKQGETMCKQDGWVLFRNSELLSGNLGKKVLGGAKNGLFFRLIRDCGAQSAIACMSRIAKLTSRWLMNRGFTIGIDDVNAGYGRGGSKVKVETKRITDEKYEVVSSFISDYNSGKQVNKPGCNAEQTLEALVNGELGRIRDTVGAMCEEKLAFANKPRIMATCGSKGSPINLCQMMACLGQQNVGGQRIKDGFVHRTLPHFTKGSKEPKARGFVENSFYSGLEATEFFFHTMGGREGLVDTAVKTAITGYMQRRLIKALEDLALKYDLTVRTSLGEVVQFAFGDDGLNPAKMEGSASKPLDFEYMMRYVTYVLRPPSGLKVEGATKRRRTEVSSLVIRATPDLPKMEEGCIGRSQSSTPISRSVEETESKQYKLWPLLPLELERLAEPCAERFAAWVRKTHGSADLEVVHLQESIASYIRDLAKKVAGKRLQLRLEPGDTEESAAAARKAWRLSDALSLMDMGPCPTLQQLDAFVNRCALKYVQAMLMPGEAVGAVAAQSIGEPATQMTLKTFHFAGVASMNVTLGVPRIQEIINAVKNISTPIITCTLVDEYCEASARIIKGRIERTTLEDICLYTKEVYEPAKGCFISVKVDANTVRKLQLELTVQDIKQALLDPKNLGGIRLTENDIDVIGQDKLQVRPPKMTSSNKMLFFSLQALKRALPKAVVKGLQSAKRAVLHKKEEGDKVKYSMLIEGFGLREVMATPGVDHEKTSSNHVMEVEKVLGIEAARKKIMQEISLTMGFYGIAIDARHIQMLGDCMTYRGAVLGINRYGISRMRASALALASFEQPIDLIFDAAARRRHDPVKGVSECVIMGSTMNLGTGLFKLLHDFGGRNAAAAPPPKAPGGAGPGSASPTVGASASWEATQARTPLLRNWRKRVTFADEAGAKAAKRSEA
eukprot:TRINITY_DN14859_c1_g1_i1.p1 TRINITY_DN14859_c1_g1~~TRINITY_DN14859_c1_g1_i1.p1  ORF type:complete len:1545 (+),score=399.75 TRINITY_DN14859_c1_g1_i1:144-4778(+)